jgi:PAS domain S-box-containing protein
VSEPRGAPDLGESEARYRAIVEAEPQCVKVLAPDGTLLEMNPAGLRMIEADSLEQVRGALLTALVVPEHRAAFQELHRSVMAGGSGSLEFEIVGLKGGRRWLETHAVPLKDRQGRVSALLGITADITTRRALEDRLRQAQKMEAVGQLAGGIAHDFNNLLTAILSSADLLEADLAADDPRRADVAAIRQAAERAAQLTRQLLAFSRQQILQPTLLDLNLLVARLEGLLRRVIPEHVHLETRLAENPALVYADPSQLEQVILNLVVNARDAMPEGGSIGIETELVTLDAGFVAAHPGSTAGPHVRLAVSDTGCGMDPATLARIFEPFFTTKAPGQGTGLGLAVVYGIVKQSGGYIGVESEPGRGSRFQIYLPEAAGSPAPSEAQREPQDLFGSETVLVVEDDPGVRRLARRSLQRYGYRVLEAANGREAVQVARHHQGPIHLLLTDWVMPEMGGRRSAEQILLDRPELRVLYMSGYPGDEGTQGLGPFLEKPFTPEVLARKVREVLDAS